MITEMQKVVLLAVLIGSLLFTQQNPSFAQQNPPGLDWRQIQTERFKVIFPAAITTDAQRVANTLEHIYGPVSKTLRGQQKPLEVVLVNQTTEPNGFFSLAPRRSVWNSTPSPNIGLFGGSEWYQLLALHEIRHAVQTDRHRRGLIRLMWIAFGETAETIVGNLLTPQWFAEGDAVGVETALSQAGRGRDPQFGLNIRGAASGGTSLLLLQSLSPLVSRLVSEPLPPRVFSDDLRQTPLWA